MGWANKWFFGLVVVVVLTGAGQAQDIFDAVSSGNIDLVRDLITADSSLINATNSRGMTPLRLAVSAGNLEITGLLLDRGAKTDDTHPMYGSIMNQAFISTCQRNGGPELVQLLIQRGLAFDAGQTDALGMSPLDWAVQFGNLSMARLALEHGADVNLTSQRLKRPPLITAVSKGYADIADLLLEKGADVSVSDQLGNTAIFYAVDQGRLSTLNKLLARGASATVKGPHYGRSMLHLAAIRGFRDIAEVLVSHQAVIDAADMFGKTPLYYALKYGNHEVADFLTAKGADKPQDSETSSRRPAKAKGDIGAGDATIWYLNHRGWVVQTKSHDLVFDAEEFRVRRSDNPSLSNGFLTVEELANCDVVALYSCYHGNPGEPAYIHTLADSLKHISYVHLVDDAWRGSPNTTYLKSQADTTIGDIALRTIEIMDDMPTLAYLINVDELNIYYQAFASDNPERLKHDYESLAASADTVDIAFLPLPEPGSEEESDLRLFLDRFYTRALCLLDPARREYLFPDAARKVADWGFSTKVFCAENPGDHFDFVGSTK